MSEISYNLPLQLVRWSFESRRRNNFGRRTEKTYNATDIAIKSDE
jgi:hypothetical protein